MLEIKISEPPPKEDIILENVGTRKTIFINIFVFFGIFIILLIISLYLNYLLNYLMKSMNNFLITIVSSLLILIINIISNKVIESLNFYERHSSFSGLDSSSIIKTSCFLFFHTSFVTIFMNINNIKDFFTSNGFFDVILMLFIYTICIYQFTNSICSVPWFKYFYRRIIIWFGIKKLNKIDQDNQGTSSENLRDHNNLINKAILYFLSLFYARPQFEYADRYSYRIFILWLTIFLVPLYPLIVIFPLITFIIEYLLDLILIKYSIYRKSRIFGPKLNHYFLSLIRVSYFIYLGSSIYYFSKVKVTFFIYLHIIFLLVISGYLFIIIIYRAYCKKDHEPFWTEFQNCNCKFLTELLSFLNPYESTYEVIEMKTQKYLSSDYEKSPDYIDAEDFRKQFQSKVKFNDYSFKIKKLIKRNINTNDTNLNKKIFKSR